MVAAGGRSGQRTGGRPPKPASEATDAATRRTLAPGRSRRLRDAILARFSTIEAFEEWAVAHAQAHDYTPLTEATLVQIDRGITPSLPRVHGLAAATDLPFEDVARELGVDFGELPRLRAALGSGFTRVEPDSLVFPTREFHAPAEWAPWADPFAPEHLAPLVARWDVDTVTRLADLARPHRRTVLLDEPYGPGYPRVPLRALLHVDTSETKPVRADRFYLVEHPYGWACCRVLPHGAGVTLHSEDRDYHPPLEFPAANVRIHGRVVTFAARIDRQRRPVPKPLSELERGTGPWRGPTFWKTASSTAMLQYVWNRRQFSYQSLRADVARLHDLSRQFRQSEAGQGRRRGMALSVGSLQNHLDPDKRVMPVLATVFALAAVFGVEVRDFVRACGVPISDTTRQPVPGEAGESTAVRMQRLRTHPFGVHLEREGWDLAWLISLLRWGRADRVYHLGTSNFEMTALMRPNAFVAIDPLQRPARQGSPEAASEETDWQRPLYLLRTSSRAGLVCAYCETTADGNFWLIPHPRAARRMVEYLPRQEAAVLGRVTHVATLL